jgi:hypothetical protein
MINIQVRPRPSFVNHRILGLLLRDELSRVT